MSGYAVTCSSVAILFLLRSPSLLNVLSLNAVELQTTTYLHISNMSGFAVTCCLASILYAIHIYNIYQDML